MFKFLLYKLRRCFAPDKGHLQYVWYTAYTFKFTKKISQILSTINSAMTGQNYNFLFKEAGPFNSPLKASYSYTITNTADNSIKLIFLLNMWKYLATDYNSQSTNMIGLWRCFTTVLTSNKSNLLVGLWVVQKKERWQLMNKPKLWYTK